MSLRLKSAGAIVFVNLALSAGSTQAGEFGENRVGLDLLQLDRKTDQAITYVWDNNGTVNSHGDDSVAGTTGVFDDTADIGYRLEGAYRLSSKWSLQGGYMTTGKLSEAQSLSDSSSQLEIFWTGGTDEFDSADTVQASYTSELDGLELNFVYNLSDRVDLFAGIGQLNLDEKFHIVSDDTGTTGIGRYNINTSNDMLGTQFGVNLNYPATDKLGLYLLAKLGWYDNSNEQHQTVSDPVVSANRNVTVAGDTSSKTREVRLGGSYAFTSDLRMNLGYQYIKVTDVALAESQFDVQAGGTRLTNSDDITWQGLHLGVNYYF